MTTDTKLTDYEVGKKLKHEREKQQYTQAGLGSKIGVLEKQMSRYERGDFNHYILYDSSGTND